MCLMLPSYKLIVLEVNIYQGSNHSDTCFRRNLTSLSTLLGSTHLYDLYQLFFPYEIAIAATSSLPGLKTEIQKDFFTIILSMKIKQTGDSNPVQLLCCPSHLLKFPPLSLQDGISLKNINISFLPTSQV